MNGRFQCPHFTICSGCTSELSELPPSVWQEIISYYQDRVVPVLNQGSPIHWRCRAKLAVRGGVLNPSIGLFKRHSHQVIPIPDCLVHHPKINQAIEYIRLWMVDNKIVPYQETTNQGELRYLQLVVERQTGKIQASFVVNAKGSSERWKELLLQLEGLYPQCWHSLWLNFNEKQTNTIFGPTWLKISGEEFLREKFGDTTVYYLPATFGQANLDLFEKMLQRIYQWIPPQSNVTEFFAGVGAIGICVAEKCLQVMCEEFNENAEVCFAKAKKQLPKTIGERLSYSTLPVEKALHLMEEATSVIVDPPRKGLSNNFKEALSRSATKQLIYVSCGWESFQRDGDDLLKQGWALTNFEGFTFFPGSDHIEILANFTK